MNAKISVKFLLLASILCLFPPIIVSERLAYAVGAAGFKISETAIVEIEGTESELAFSDLLDAVLATAAVLKGTCLLL